MKVLVPVKRVVDYNVKVRVKSDQSGVDIANVKMSMNPFDEIAVEEATRLKEKGAATEVVAVSCGVAQCQETLRTALAIGADEGVRIDAPENDSFSVATEIATYAKAQSFDLILCGKETIQYNGGVVPGFIAEMLDLPYVAGASKLEVNGTAVKLEREIATGIEVFESTLPMVVSAAKGMAEQRIPNMRGIMAARTKPLATVPSCGASANTSVLQFNMPPAKSGCKMIAPEDAASLIQLLHEEAKVI